MPRPSDCIDDIIKKQSRNSQSEPSAIVEGLHNSMVLSSARIEKAIRYGREREILHC